VHRPTITLGGLAFHVSPVERELTRLAELHTSEVGMLKVHKSNKLSEVAANS
jgi:hypothetical protein